MKYEELRDKLIKVVKDATNEEATRNGIIGMHDFSSMCS